jgi:predicted glycosyltransferase
MKKILIDIGHPAHIHYFKNCAQILSQKGYDFFFTVRERDSTIELIQSTGYHYISRGKGGGSLIKKVLDAPRISNTIYNVALDYQPDMCLSVASAYLGKTAKKLNIPYIALDDTELAILEHKVSWPYASVILSPSCYYGKLDKKQLLFNANLEMLYLHPNYFTPDPSIYHELGIEPGEKYCILRFISWDANHDVGQKGLSFTEKIAIVDELSKYSRVFISSEGKLPDSLLKYKFTLHPKRLHDALSFASLYIGEGATTASESAVLGTPSFYANSMVVGNCNEESRYGLAFTGLSFTEIIERSIAILKDPESKNKFLEKRKNFLKEKIDPTAFLCWFIENYPESEKIMRSNPDYQYRFR